MGQSETKSYIEEKLPTRLVIELYKLAQKYDSKGAQLFLFGSFANSRSTSTSDLDLGVIWSSVRSHQTFSDLYGDVRELPTIRKIDLVDMEQVDRGFRVRVMANPIFFLNQKEGINEQR